MESTPTPTIIQHSSSPTEVPRREDVPHPGRPAIPDDPVAAEAALPWFRQRVTDTYRRYQRAKREWEQAAGELAIVGAAARGEFAPETTYATGSSGPWRIDLDARSRLTDAGREALR